MKNTQSRRGRKLDEMARTDMIAKALARGFFGMLIGGAIAFLLWARLVFFADIGAWALLVVPCCAVLAIVLGDLFWSDTLRWIFIGLVGLAALIRILMRLSN